MTKRRRILAVTALVVGLGLAAIGIAPRPGEGAIIDPTTPVPPPGTEGGPTRPLDATEMAQWVAGRLVFDHDWSQTRGVGTPFFNADSCRACHQVPVIGGAGGLELNVLRYGQDGGNPANFTDLPHGQVASRLSVAGVERDEAETVADVFEQRQTPSILGLGEIDTIFDASILANEDPNDLDGDGIRGVAHLINVNGVMEVGKFGWKAQLPRLLDFLRDAMLGENGITTPDDGRGLVPNTDSDAVPDPELTQQEFDDCGFFMLNLSPPPRGGSTDPAVAQGETVFGQIGCAKCHIPSLMGSNGPVPAYTDLLLHNVMPPGFRGVVQGAAGVGMFRTPPLWGISRTAPYMHDGRAETLFDAIMMHDGEAAGVTAAFMNLSAADQAALLLFLEDL